MQIVKLPTLTLLVALFSASLHADTDRLDKALIMVNSGSLETQAMAMVLGNAIQGQGAQVDVLLCDAGARLALTETDSNKLKPADVTPEQLMLKLQAGGANIAVCALFLPNSGKVQADLRPGINVAKPPMIAKKMMEGATRVFVY